MSYYNYAPYVPVAARRAKAKKKMENLRKKGKNIQPIEIEGRKITRTFWGSAWCDHLEKFSDYSNRLPRGRTYARNGSVCHLEINKGQIKALVSGSSLYEIEIDISALSTSRWNAIKKESSGKIGSMIELLQGKISSEVMEIVTDQDTGLFPSPREIDLNCNCPDWATMCKHIAAVLYGVGARLDHQPELLFVLRGVDHNELISGELHVPTGKSKRRQIRGDLSDVFGIELDSSTEVSAKTKKASATQKKQKAPPLKAKKAATTKSEPSPKITIRPTGKSVVRLRKRLGMNLTEFSRLVGVSAQTISKWENHPTLLRLKPENLLALSVVSKLDKVEASKKLSD